MLIRRVRLAEQEFREQVEGVRDGGIQNLSRTAIQIQEPVPHSGARAPAEVHRSRRVTVLGVRAAHSGRRHRDVRMEQSAHTDGQLLGAFRGARIDAGTKPEHALLHVGAIGHDAAREPLRGIVSLAEFACEQAACERLRDGDPDAAPKRFVCDSIGAGHAAKATLSDVDPVAATLVILVLAIVAFVSNRIPLGVVAIGVSLALFFTGVLTLPQALAGFGDPTVIFIATLFVVSESLDATGVTAWAGQQVIGRAGTKRMPLLIVICGLVAVTAAVISINGAVAALLPLVVVVAARAGIQTSQLLMPLAFAASAGSLLLLTGTPVNIIVSEFAAENGGRAFGYFEFALVGVPLVLVTIAFLALFGAPLLPQRHGTDMPLDLVRHARLLRRAVLAHARHGCDHDPAEWGDRGRHPPAISAHRHEGLLRDGDARRRSRDPGRTPGGG